MVFTRRSVLTGSAAAGLGTASVLHTFSASSAASAVEACEASSIGLPVVQPQPADSLVDAYGICVHMNFRTSVYGDTGRVIEWVQRLGARHVRSRLVPSRDVLDSFAQFARRGIKVQGTCGARADDQRMSTIMQAVKRRFDDPTAVFDGFEGINEPNNDGVPWVRTTRRKTRELFEARRAAGLTAIPIVAPSLARVTRGGVEGDDTYEQSRRLGRLDDVVDFGNMHIYPQGRPPDEDIPYYRNCAEFVAGTRQIMCTEGGYFTALQYRGTANPVPPRVAAAYAPQQLLEHLQSGTKRFYRYELLDEPNPGPQDREGTLGTISTDNGTWRPKPDFAPVQRLLRMFSDPGPAGFTPRAIRLDFRERPRDLRWEVFGKRDGTRLLVMWLDRYLWEPIEQHMMVRSLTEPLETVEVVLGAPRDLLVQRLTDPSYAARHRGVQRQRVGLSAGLTIVSIT